MILRTACAAWNRFWFERQETSTLALVRIALGLVVVAWTLSLSGDLFAFFATDGIQPSQPKIVGVWGLLRLAPGQVAVALLFAALLLAAVCMTVGFQTRLASLVVFVGLLSFERRSPLVFNAGDQLLRILAFYMMLAPSGSALSIDRRLNGGRLMEFPVRAPWALRLIQLQLSFVYIGAVWAKVQGATWNDGTAVSYALRLTDLQRLPIPSFVAHSVTLSALLTYGTLAIELSVGLLVWNRRLRPWVLGSGVLLHLGIDWSLRVGFFTLAVFVMYLAFLPPERASALIRAVPRRIARAAPNETAPIAR